MKTPEEYFESEGYNIEPSQRMIYTAMFDFAKKYAEYYHKEMTRKPKGKTLEERFDDFHAKLNYYIEEYGHNIIEEFVSYWTEHNEGGKKMRFEMSKNQPFNIKRRLATWKRMSKTTQNNSKQNAMDLLRKELGI